MKKESTKKKAPSSKDLRKPIKIETSFERLLQLMSKPLTPSKSK